MTAEMYAPRSPNRTNLATRSACSAGMPRMLDSPSDSSGWLGASNSVREIVKELPIYERERRFGLSPVAYLTSKVGVLAALTIVQSLTLVAVAIVGYPVVPNGALLGTGVEEL